MAISHIFTSPVADQTGTVTVFNSAGVTTTTAASALVRPSNWNSVHNQFLTISGNTAGASTASGTNLVFQGGANITLSVTDQTIIFSNNGLTTARASNDAIGLNTAITQNGVSMTANSSGLSLNFPAFLTTARASNDAIGLNTAQTNVTWTVNSSGISLNAGAYLTTAAASNHSHGNPTLALTNLSGTTASASNGLTLSLSAAAPSAATLSAYAVSNTTNSTSGALPGVVSFGGYGGISLGVSNGTVQVSGPDLTSLSVTGALSASSNGSTISLGVGTVTASIIGNTTQTSTGSINLNALVFSGAGGASLGISAGTVIVSGATGGAGGGVAISAGTQSVSTGTMVFSNSNGITFGMSGSSRITASHNGLTTAAASDHSHGNPTLALTNLSGTTASASNGLTLSLSAAAQTNQSAIRGFGVSNTGVTAGNTGISTGIDWVLAGSQSLTLSQSTAGGGPNTVWIQHPAWITTAAASNHSHGNPTLALTNLSGTTASASNGLTLSLSAAAPGAAVESNAFNLLGANTAGNTTATGSTIGLSGLNLTLSGTNASQIVISAPATSSLVGAGGISLSTNGSTITVSYTKGTKSGFSPYADLPMVITTLGNGALQLDPMAIGDVQWDRLVCLVNNTNSSNSSGSHTLSFWAGLYSRNASTLSLYGSASVSYALTHSGTAGSYSLYSGVRALTMPWTTTVTDGQYWFGLISRTTSGGANGSYSMAAASVGLGSNFSGHFGSSHATTAQVTLGQGVFTVTTAGMPNSIAFTELRGSDSQNFKAPIVWFASSTV